MTFIEELNDAFPMSNDENDPSFLIEQLYFFPLDKVYISTGSYDPYLYDLEKTVIDNYDAGNYQVSFFYAHLIFMSYVYYCVERALQMEPDRMRDLYYPMTSYRGKDDKPDLDHYQSIYEFSKIPEKDIFKVFHIIGMDDDQIKALSRYISDRDDFAHATGQGNISFEKLTQDIRNIRNNMDGLSSLFLSVVREQYIDYFTQLLEYGYDSIYDSAADYVYDNGLSIHEIEYLCNLGLRKIQDEKGWPKEVYLQMKKEHCAFIEFCIENYGIETPPGFSALRDEAYLYYRYKGNASDYIENELGISAYECGKEGGKFPVYFCPKCGEEQLVYNADTQRFHCFACDQNYTEEDLTFCERCGSLMRRKEKRTICQSCIRNMMKD